jgi:CelD/BcsL family acetyltransferase involved in cellulose biosynthesis
MATTFEFPLSDAVASPDEPPVFRSIVRLEQLAEIEDAWQDLGMHSRSPIDQFNWTRCCLATVARGEQLCAAALVRDGELLAAAALIAGGTWIKRGVLIGVAQLREPMDLLWSNEQALEMLLKRLVQSGRPLVFERVPAVSATRDLLEKVCRGRALFVCRPQPSCPFIPLDARWREPESNLNSGRRSDLRRARRRAEQIGPLTTEILAPRAAELDDLLDTAFAIEDRSWKGDAGTALARDRKRAEFYRRYAHAAAAEGSLRLCFLRIGEVPAAMQLAVERGGGFWLLKIGYDAQFRACSPGLLLMRDTIAYAAASGLATYEFLGEADQWTDVWTRQERQSVSLRVYPFGAWGMAALAADAARVACRNTLRGWDQCKQRLRTWKRK